MNMTATKTSYNEAEIHHLNYAKGKITNFLNDKSENTAKNYKVDINQFTQFFFKKNLEFVLIEELEAIDSDHIIEYRNWLRNKYVNTTVNRRINSMKSLYGYLEASNPNIRKAVFNVAKSLGENPNSYGSLTWEEVEKMIELAYKLPEGHEYSVLIEVAVKTCIRLDALLNLTWDQIYDKVQDGEKIKVIEVMDKGSNHLKPISNKLYERILTLKDGREKLFMHFHPHKVGNHLDEICEWMDIDKKRNISFHSFKKAGINYVFDTTNDIMLAQQQGNHKSSATTMKSYLEHKKDLRDIPSYTMGEEIAIDNLNNLTKEQLLQAIDKLKSSSKLELLRIVKEVL
jgi:integrase